MTIKPNLERNDELVVASAGIDERLTLTEIEARIHKMRSDAMVTYAKAVSRGVTRLMRNAGRWTVAVLQYAAAVRTCEELARLDDRTLADIGLRRENLTDQVFANVFGRAKDSSEPALEAIRGGKALTTKPIVETLERHAA